MLETKKLFITWDEFHAHSKQLSNMLRDLKSWDKLVCIARGGLAPASLLSRYLDITYVDTICMSSYDDKTDSHQDLEIIKSLTSTDSNILVIDDLVDSGKSIAAARKMLPNAHFATIYGKPNGIKQIDTYLIDIPQSTWIVFPWEQ